jgi:aminoglycoside 2''-phosphotransferase
MPFRVPNPEFVGTWNGWPFFLYRKIPGRPITPVDCAAVAADLAHVLQDLHSFPTTEAARLLGVEATTAAWQQRYRDLWPTISEAVLPRLARDLRDQVNRGYQDFLDIPLDFTPCLVHCDLGPDHILLDEATGQFTGLIDFEDATVGDPAIDMLWLYRMSPPGAKRVLLGSRDWGSDLPRRMWFYNWMGSVHAILYGVLQDHPTEMTDGLAGLKLRIGQIPAVADPTTAPQSQ